MLRIGSYAIYPETDRFHRIRRIAVQPFVACMAHPLSLSLSLPLTMRRSVQEEKSRHVRMKIIHLVTSLPQQVRDRRSLRLHGGARARSGRFARIGTLSLERQRATKPAEARNAALGHDAQKNGIGVLLRTTATTSCDPARLEGSVWQQPCRSMRPGGCARCLPRAALAPPPPSRGARPKKTSAAA